MRLSRCPCRFAVPAGPCKTGNVEPQYQHEVVCKTIRRRFDIATGRCHTWATGARTGSDPWQTSDALGAEALALAVRMNKGLGIPPGDVAAVLEGRVARDVARRFRVNAIDETGWNVEAQLR